MKFRLAAALLFLLSPVASAHAASSDWATSEGGRVRLVTSGAPDAKGRLAGALQIDLKPGWKTYWRDPGEAGIPPSIDISGSNGVRSAELHFPPPHRIDDGYADAAGYDRPVALPVTFTMKEGADGPVEARVFLGICKSICVPVQADLTVAPVAGASDREDAQVVAEAEASLPQPASETFGVVGAHVGGDHFSVEARVPAGTSEASLFLAGGEGYLFGLPQPAEVKDGTARFTAKIFQKPDEAPASPPRFHYTIVAGPRSVAGTTGLE